MYNFVSVFCYACMKRNVIGMFGESYRYYDIVNGGNALEMQLIGITVCREISSGSHLIDRSLHLASAKLE